MAIFTAATATNDNTIRTFSFGPGDIISGPICENVACVTACIYPGTEKALKQIAKEHPNCCVVLLSHVNPKFSIARDKLIYATDMQLGCITATRYGDMLVDDPGYVFGRSCSDKIGKFTTTQTPTIMYNDNEDNSFVTMLDAKYMKPLKPGDLSVSQSNSPKYASREWSSRYDPSPRSASGMHSPRESVPFNKPDVTKYGVTSRTNTKSKATSIIYGEYDDIQKMLYECAGNRPVKHQRNITKLNVVPISVLLHFIENSTDRYKPAVWHRTLYGTWVKEDDP